MKGSEREGEGRQRAEGRLTGRTTDDASSSVSAKVAFVTNADKRLRAYVGITDRAAWRREWVNASRARGYRKKRTIFRHTFRRDGRWLITRGLAEARTGGRGRTYRYQAAACT